MFKKIGITALVLVIALGALNVVAPGTMRYLSSWAKVSWDNVTSGIKGHVSPEMEIKRIKVEIANLDGDIKRNFHKVAQAEAELENFAADVKASKDDLDHKRQYLTRLDAEKDVDNALFSREWDTYKIAEATLASKEKLLKQRQDLTRAADAKLKAMIAERENLKTRVADLETKLEEVRLAQTQCPVPVDDSRLSDIKGAINAVDTQIKVMKKEVEFETRFADQPSKVEVKVKGLQAREEFRARFGEKSDVVEKK
jgi:chromosome segregation ATPase